MAACVNLEDALKSGVHKDTDGRDLCGGLRILWVLLIL
jgi:hypothetical protein